MGKFACDLADVLGSISFKGDVSVSFEFRVDGAPSGYIVYHRAGL